MSEREGLEPYYDVVLLGTGLEQAALAGACARAGKTVLHLDRNEWYGEDCAGFSLEGLIDWGARVKEGHEEPLVEDIATIGRKIAEARADGSGSGSGSGVTEVGNLVLKPLRYSSSGLQVCCEPEKTAAAAAGENDENGLRNENGSNQAGEGLSVGKVTWDTLVNNSRGFTLDLTAQGLLASGSAVETCIDSGVAKYIEFKSLEGLYLATLDSDASEKMTLSRVPCSKADVFKTHLLSPLEKRLLMKFLLFVSDWGERAKGEEVFSMNERGLSQARSLQRPQNKVETAATFDVEGFLGKPFQEFLCHCKLPERLRDTVTHALGLLLTGTDKTTTEFGLSALYRHLSSLGRYGETALLLPMYGMAEFPQAFCRVAAVHGGTYMLNRGLRAAVLSQSESESKCVGVVDTQGNVFACGALVIGEDYWPSIEHAGRRVVRRISIIEGAVVEGANASAVVIPPGSGRKGKRGRRSAVHALQLGKGVAATPLSLHSQMHVLHLSTVSEQGSEDDELGLEQVAHDLLGASDQGAKEIWRMNFSRPLHKAVDSASLPCNVAVMVRQERSLYMHECLEQARESFERLFPGTAWYSPVKDEEEQEEGEMLEAVAGAVSAAET